MSTQRNNPTTFERGDAELDPRSGGSQRNSTERTDGVHGPFKRSAGGGRGTGLAAKELPLFQTSPYKKKNAEIHLEEGHWSEPSGETSTGAILVRAVPS